MISKKQKFQNLEIMEILQKRPLLGNDKHQSLTAMYVHSSQGTVGDDVFLLVCNKLIYDEPVNLQESPCCLSLRLRNVSVETEPERN
jgi:hypothetical protein